MAKNVEIEQTEIEAPYELPEGWKWATIGDCCEKAFSGKSPKYSKEITPYKIIGQQANQRYGIDLSFIKYGTKEFAEAQQDFYYLQYNDVLLNTLGTGSIGRSGIYKYDEKILTDGHPFVFRTEKKYVADLLFYYLRLNEQEIINTANGSTNQKFLSLKSFLKFPIPYPPTLAEQQRIVNRIETMFAKLDQAQEKAQAVLDSFETRKAAILHKAFTGELTANWRKENGVSDDSWEEKKIGDICTVVRGGSPRPAGDSKYYDGSIPFMKVADITGNDSKYVYSTEYTIKEAGLYKTRMVDADTLLLTNSGATLGVPAITKIKTTFNDGIAAFLNLPEESNLYFYYFWTSKTTELRTINMGAAQPNLNIDIISNIIAPVPTSPEQQEIVRILDTVLEKESRAKEAAQTVLDQIALLKKSILARAFRGEL